MRGETEPPRFPHAPAPSAPIPGNCALRDFPERGAQPFQMTLVRCSDLLFQWRPCPPSRWLARVQRTFLPAEKKSGPGLPTRSPGKSTGRREEKQKPRLMSEGTSDV